MHPEELRLKILEHEKIEQCEYVANQDDTYSVVFRIDGKRYGGRLKGKGIFIDTEDAEIFLQKVIHTPSDL